MTEKRFTTDNGSNEDVCLVDNITGKEYESNFDDIVDLLNELHEENIQLKELLNKLEEFEVFESDRIHGAVVTNNEYSVTLHSNNEAYMVCNMINRFIRSVMKW